MNKIKIEVGQIWKCKGEIFTITSIGFKYGRNCCFSDNTGSVCDWLNLDGSGENLSDGYWTLTYDPNNCQEDCCKRK